MDFVSYKENRPPGLLTREKKRKFVNKNHLENEQVKAYIEDMKKLNITAWKGRGCWKRGSQRGMPLVKSIVRCLGLSLAASDIWICQNVSW